MKLSCYECSDLNCTNPSTSVVIDLEETEPVLGDDGLYYHNNRAVWPCHFFCDKHDREPIEKPLSEEIRKPFADKNRSNPEYIAMVKRILSKEQV